VDGVEHTDGIDVSTASLGPAFAGGVFVAQDGRNPGGNQNFKLVPWPEISRALTGRLGSA
jgi:3-phytase